MVIKTNQKEKRLDYYITKWRLFNYATQQYATDNYIKKDLSAKITYCFLTFQHSLLIFELKIKKYNEHAQN